MAGELDSVSGMSPAIAHIAPVGRSVMQSRWLLPATDDAVIERIAREHALPEIIARLIHGRKIPHETIDRFLNPRLAQHFPDPLSLAGMADAADWLADAITARKSIAIFGDFDVDGATSTAIMVRFLRHYGIEPPIYIPDRLKEGYGPNVAALAALKEKGAEIVILVDCGITAFDVIAQGAAMGLDVMVIDHHQAEATLPPARHVINPKRVDDRSGLTMLAACGVAFMTCVATQSALRHKGAIDPIHGEARLKDWLDIVALGTVCDMVPLTSVNRLFVRAGFARMAQMANPGLKALCAVARVTGEPTPYHAGYMLGPRINAGSRVHQADLGARLLCIDDAEEARNIAFLLEDCNARRRTIQQEMVEQAVALVEMNGLHERPVIVVGDESWHPGLSGLVAGHLKERYGKPAVVVTYTVGESGRLEGRGSGRSIAGANIGAAFIEARNQGLAVKGGGHAMAAGFTIQPDQLDRFSRFVEDHVASQLQGTAATTDMTLDSMMSIHGLKPELARMLQDRFGPFGADHPEPVFMFANVRLHSADLVGSDHVRCVVADWEGGPRVKAMAFRAADTALGQHLLGHRGDLPLHIAGTLKLDSWNGTERVEVHIQDAAVPENGGRK